MKKGAKAARRYLRRIRERMAVRPTLRERERREKARQDPHGPDYWW